MNESINTIKQPKKLRAKQIKDQFGIGLSTVWHYASIGKLTPIRVSERVTVFDTKEVEALFSNKA